MAINPTGNGLKAFLAAGADEPVVMLNLLRFAEDGKTKYDEYVAHFTQHSATFGAKVIYFGYGDSPLVAEQGQDWDAVLLVSYPTRQAFSDMVRDPEYHAGAHLRTEALSEAVLQPTSPQTS